MPDRILRDEVWLSDRFLDLPTDACRLGFLRMVSEADDFGNLEGGLKRLFRLLSPCTQIKSETALAATLEALIEADLVRMYKVDGRELMHIPRTRPHRQYIVRKMPVSPWDADIKLGKTQRIESRGLAKDQQNQHQTEKRSNDVVTTSHAYSSDVAQGVGVGVGVGVGEKKEKGARKRAPDFDPSEIEIPDWLNREDWRRWCADRRDRRKPITAEGAKSQIKKLDGYRRDGFSPGDVIEHSIAGGFQGLYTPARNGSQPRATANDVFGAAR